MGLLRPFGVYAGIIYFEEIPRCFESLPSQLCLCGRWSMLRTGSRKLPHLRLEWRCSREIEVLRLPCPVLQQDGRRWRSRFAASFVEEITRRTGNAKKQYPENFST